MCVSVAQLKPALVMNLQYTIDTVLYSFSYARDIAEWQNACLVVQGSISSINNKYFQEKNCEAIYSRKSV